MQLREDIRRNPSDHAALQVGDIVSPGPWSRKSCHTTRAACTSASTSSWVDGETAKVCEESMLRAKTCQAAPVLPVARAWYTTHGQWTAGFTSSKAVVLVTAWVPGVSVQVGEVNIPVPVGLLRLPDHITAVGARVLLDG